MLGDAAAYARRCLRSGDRDASLAFAIRGHGRDRASRVAYGYRGNVPS
jgi:hypothetical protein